VIVFPVEIVAFLAKKHGERLVKALHLYTSELVWNLTVESNEISASVRGEHGDVYSCFLGSEGETFCSCTDHQTRKVICKHIHLTLLAALERELITREEYMAKLI